MNPLAIRIPVLLLSCALLGAGVAAEESTDPWQVVQQAKARARTISAQAEALVGLAWPADGPRDPQVAAAARAELVFFGNHSLPAVRRAIKEVIPLYRADAVATLVEARRQARSGSPPDYLPGLEDAIWHGSIEAKRIGMQEITRHVYPPAVLSIIDAIHAHQELTLPGLRALGRLGDQRGRFFIGRALDLGDVPTKRTAAQAFAGLGEAGLLALRQRATNDDRDVREAAIAGLLPLARTDDLTLIHEYVGSHADDDPSLMQRVQARATELEALLEDQQLSEAASAENPPDNP